MARKPAGLTLAQMVRPIRRFTDAANGLFAAMDQVQCSQTEDITVGNPERDALPQIPWSRIRKFERAIVLIAVHAAESAMEELAQDLQRMGDHKKKEWIQWAVDLAQWSLRAGREHGMIGGAAWDFVATSGEFFAEKFCLHDLQQFVAGLSCTSSEKYELTAEKEVQQFEVGVFSFHSLNKFYIRNLRRAVGWLSFVDDVATLEGFESWKRDVLQAILEAGPLTGEQIVDKAWGGSNASKKGRRLSEMVKAGLLFSDKGANSGGYRLTPYGWRLAQLCAQLGA